MKWKCTVTTTACTSRTRSTRMTCWTGLRLKGRCRNIRWCRLRGWKRWLLIVGKNSWIWRWKLVGRRTRLRVKKCWQFSKNTSLPTRSTTWNKMTTLSSVSLWRASKTKYRNASKLKSPSPMLTKSDLPNVMINPFVNLFKTHILSKLINQ